MLAAVIFASLLPANLAKAQLINIFYNNKLEYSTIGSSTAGEIENGAKNVETEITALKLKYYTDYNLASQDSLNKITIRANNRVLERDEVEVKCADGVITFNIKGYKLKEHTLYTIYVPGWTFKHKDGLTYNEEKYFSFVTKNSNTRLNSNLVKQVTVGEKVIYSKQLIEENKLDQVNKGLDNTKGKITIEFIDDVDLSPEAISDYESFIHIATTPVAKDLPAYDNSYPYQSGDFIGAYKVYTEGNKLILEPRYGALKDFANYTIALEPKTVYLRNSYFGESQTPKIYNDYFNEISFDTANMLAATSPANNAEKVDTEPVIRFHFKYPVKILSSDMVEISEGGSVFSADPRYNVYLSGEAGNDKVLIVNINDLENNSPYRLRKNTVYRVTLKIGAVALKDYEREGGGNVENHKIDLYFITGGDGQAPVVTGYSSDLDKTDDIRYLNHTDKKVVLPDDKVTNLDSDGSIYVHIDRPIREDKQTEFLSLLGATHLYKLPKAEEVGYDQEGRRYDKKLAFTYNPNGSENSKVMPSNSSGLFEEEIPVGSVELVTATVLKITPKVPLSNLTKHRLTIDKRVIEDYNGYNLEKDVNFQFWTKADNKDSKAQWKNPYNGNAQNIKENKDLPYVSYTIFGTPIYSKDLPMVLNIDGEVIPKAKDAIIKQKPNDPVDERIITFDKFLDISLTDVYNTNSAVKYRKFEKYEVEYYFDNGVKKTRLYLYPAPYDGNMTGELGSGKRYQLKIPQGVFETRSGNNLDALEINFVTESSINGQMGVYQLQDNTAKVTDVWAKGEWTFKLLGYNFHEYIANVNNSIIRVELYNEARNETVTIQNTDIEFVNVTEMLVKIRGTNAQNFAKESYAGLYKVNIVYFDSATNGEQVLTVAQGTSVETDIEVKGKDFRPDIEKVTLKKSGSVDKNLTLEPGDVQFVDSTKLILKIRGDNVGVFEGFGGSGGIEVNVVYKKRLTIGQDMAELSYDLYGYGFSNPVYKVIFKPVSGKAMSLPAEEQEIVIMSDGIQVDSDTKLTAKFTGSNMDKLKDPERAGVYQAIVKFARDTNMSDFTSQAIVEIFPKDVIQITETVRVTDPLSGAATVKVPNHFTFELLSKGKPKVLDYYPKPLTSGMSFDEKGLTHPVKDYITQNKYFLKVVFEDIDGTLTFNSITGLTMLKDNTTVYGAGSSNSMVDGEFLNQFINMSAAEQKDKIETYIFTKDRAKGEAYLYIPVRLLQSQIVYNVVVASGIVSNDAQGSSSSTIMWSFATLGNPYVERISSGSLSEDYSKDTFLIINGSYFNSGSVKVFFNSIEASKVLVKVDNGGKQYLEVYLPSGNDRLTPGIYNITVKNGENHERVSQGALSILKAAQQTLGDNGKLKDKTSSGDVIANYNASEDTLELNTAKTGLGNIQLNLDQLMGEDVWTRKIKYLGNTRNTIEKLQTTSKWANISIYELTLDPSSDDRDIVIKVGRVEPSLAQTLKAKLEGKLIRSDLIQVTGTNFTFNQIDLSIPYKGSESSLTILRYDESTRNWVEESGTTNPVDKVVKMTTDKTGIFVVVE